MFNIGTNRFGSTSSVVTNLLFINGLMLLATYVLKSKYNIDLTESLALYYPESTHFKVYQLITHMFMHADPTHLFFNMFSLWMFGRALEDAWGSKRFLVYYISTGLGAALLHSFVNFIEIAPLKHFVLNFAQSPTPALMADFAEKFIENPIGKSQFLNFVADWKLHPNSHEYANMAISGVYSAYDSLISIPTIGASGAVYGVLLGFGMLFPNTVLMLIFPPIPIKAKWMVIIFAGIELTFGIAQPGSNIAHFAHLGGMLFGYLIIRYWNSKRTNFY
jgi:membrane associated rhomboid family serine protease